MHVGPFIGQTLGHSGIATESLLAMLKYLLVPFAVGSCRCTFGTRADFEPGCSFSQTL